MSDRTWEWEAIGPDGVLYQGEDKSKAMAAGGRLYHNGRLVTVIKRSEWMRGNGEGLLFDSGSGQRCCLGFRMNLAGFDDEELDNVGTPCTILEHTIKRGTQKHIPEWLLNTTGGKVESGNGHMIESGNSTLCNKAMHWNDMEDPSIGWRDNEERVEESADFEARREREIAAIFEAAGEEVEFVD